MDVEVIEMPGGNGTKLPFAVKIDGEYLRGKNGVARRFKTREAAQAAASAAIPFNAALDEHLTGLGYARERVEASWEDGGDAENGPKLEGGPAFDCYTGPDEYVYASEIGVLDRNPRDAAFEKFLDEEASTHADPDPTDWRKPRHPGDAVREVYLVREGEIGSVAIRWYRDDLLQVVGFLPGRYVCVEGDTPKTEPDYSVDVPRETADDMLDECVLIARGEGWSVKPTA